MREVTFGEREEQQQKRHEAPAPPSSPPSRPPPQQSPSSLAAAAEVEGSAGRRRRLSRAGSWMDPDDVEAAGGGAEEPAGGVGEEEDGGGGGGAHRDTTSMSDGDDDGADDDGDSDEEAMSRSEGEEGDDVEAAADAANADALPPASPLFPAGSLPRDVAAALGRRALRALETRVASGDGGAGGGEKAGGGRGGGGEAELRQQHHHQQQQHKHFEPGSPGWPGARLLPPLDGGDEEELGGGGEDEDGPLHRRHHHHHRYHRDDGFVGEESPPPSSFEKDDDGDDDEHGGTDSDSSGGGARGRNRFGATGDDDDAEGRHFRHLFSRPLAFCVNCTAPIWPERQSPSLLQHHQHAFPGEGFPVENGDGEENGSRMASGDGGGGGSGRAEDAPAAAAPSLPPPPPVPRLPELCSDCGRPTAPGGNDDLFSPGEEEQGKQQHEATFALPLPPPTSATTEAPPLASPSSSSSSSLPPVVLAYDDRMLGHEEARGPGRAPHPERPDRLRAAVARLLRSGVAARCSRMAAREATDAELSAVHSPALVAAVDALSLRSAARERAVEASAAAEEAAKVEEEEEVEEGRGGGKGIDEAKHKRLAEARARAAEAAARASAALAASSAAASRANAASSAAPSFGNGSDSNGSGGRGSGGGGSGMGSGGGSGGGGNPAALAGTPPTLSQDTYINASTAGAARLAAGASADVATAVASGLARSGLAIVRPPGHHAESNTAQGFCLFNNAAVACRAAQRAGARRVLCFDWDVHHGNGTQAILEEDAEVCYVSVHRHDGGHFYPGTGSARERGRGKGLGATLNVPWPRGGMGDADYLAALAHVVLPCCYEFNPDVVVVSAGFDAASGDPIGGCDVTPAAFAHMLHALAAVAPTVLLLEGGYNLDATAEAVEACARVALGERPPRLLGGAVEAEVGGGGGDVRNFFSSPCSSSRLAPQPVAMLTLHEVAVANAEHWACLRGLAGEQPFAPSAAPFSRFGGSGGGAGVIEEEVYGYDDVSGDDDGIEDLRPRGEEKRLFRERRRRERLLLQQQQQLNQNQSLQHALASPLRDAGAVLVSPADFAALGTAEVEEASGGAVAAAGAGFSLASPPPLAATLGAPPPAVLPAPAATAATAGEGGGTEGGGGCPSARRNRNGGVSSPRSPHGGRQQQQQQSRFAMTTAAAGPSASAAATAADASLDARLEAALARSKLLARRPQGRSQRRLRVMHALHLVALQALVKQHRLQGSGGGGGGGASGRGGGSNGNERGGVESSRGQSHELFNQHLHHRHHQHHREREDDD